jgi:hypothetical protein
VDQIVQSLVGQILQQALVSNSRPRHSSARDQRQRSYSLVRRVATRRTTLISPRSAHAIQQDLTAKGNVVQLCVITVQGEFSEVTVQPMSKMHAHSVGLSGLHPLGADG